MVYEFLTEFQGQRVIEFENARSWKGPEYAYRVRMEYDDEQTMQQRLELLLSQPKSDQLQALIIGLAEPEDGDGGMQDIGERLIALKSRLPNLLHLFLGEIISEECEISWIVQGNLTPLLLAYPQLQTLRIRGGNGLSFTDLTRHDGLRELAIETGGLPRSVLREIQLAEFPQLEHLELLLGSSNYGFDGTVEDLLPLLSGRLFPKLKFLGLMNSEIANEIAAVVVNSPIVERIETLDLSLGNLDAEGGRALLNFPKTARLKCLNICHHYVPNEVVQQLRKTLPFEVRAEPSPYFDDEEWRPIAYSE